jgi:hypothetical protein
MGWEGIVALARSIDQRGPNREEDAVKLAQLVLHFDRESVKVPIQGVRTTRPAVRAAPAGEPRATTAA